MKDMILITLHWLHLMATVVWVGGIVFVLFIAIPSARQSPGVDSAKVMGEISKRFAPLANYSIALLVITGIALTWMNEHFSGIDVFNNSWTLILALKHMLVLGMIAIHFYRSITLAPKIARAGFTEEKANLQKLSINLVKVNLGLGALVLALSGATNIV